MKLEPGKSTNALLWAWKVLLSKQIVMTSRGVGGTGERPPGLDASSTVALRAVAVWVILWGNILPLAFATYYATSWATRHSASVPLSLLVGAVFFLVLMNVGLLVQAVLLRPYTWCVSRIISRGPSAQTQAAGRALDREARKKRVLLWAGAVLLLSALWLLARPSIR